jgi:cystathionine beta-lyase/cystathionine gamma-synthase
MSRPLSPPLVLSSTFAFERQADLTAAVAGSGEHLYSRWSNPTISGVEQRIAALENAERALLVSSGMAAVHLALRTALDSASGPLVVQREIYGGTHELLSVLDWGRPVTRVAVSDWATTALPDNAIVYVELPTNPTIRLLDVAALRRAAPTAFIVVDATFASPALLRPLDLGADLVLHSATKALGGHHDLVAGVLSGRAELIDRAWRWRKVLGPCLDPAAAWRLGRGLDTLELRVRKASESARTLALRLAERPGIAAVHHPSTPGHPDHALASRLFVDGLPGSVFSFEVGSGDDAGQLIDRLQRFATAASLGGTHSLATWPAGVTHANVDDAGRRAAGIEPGLIRLAVGLEDVELLWADLAAALA